MVNRVASLLGIEYPVVQAPLSWNTSAELVAAVSDAGGLGVLGPFAGRRTIPSGGEEYDESLRHEIDKVRKLTKKPFAVNLIPPFEGNPDGFFVNATLQTIIEKHVQVVAMVAFDFPAAIPYIEKCRLMNIKVVYRDITPTVKAALMAEKVGIHAYVATGFEEGGSLPRYHTSTLSIVSQITDVLTIPVLAAGGIVTKKTAAAVKALGAEGVYAGTRFIATRESPTNDDVKQIIISSKSEDMIDIGPVGRETRIVKRADGIVPEVIHGSECLGMLVGDLSNGRGNVIVDGNIGAIHEVISAFEAVRMLGEPFIS